MAVNIVDDSSGRKTPPNLMTAIIESGDDLTDTRLANAAPGSMAYKQDGSSFFVKGVDGTWRDWLAESASP